MFKHILHESSKSKGKRYRCQYCGQMFYRDDLINHIAKKHEELIPENYTARRLVFNQINRKETGYCVICKQEVGWNEDIGRYEKFCSQKCKDEAARRAEENMKRVLGMGRKERMSLDSVQNNMLSNRSISGTYRFSSGGERGYVGSYEKKLLEFADEALHLKAIHIETPGPTIEYEFNGEKHFWITDQYWEPWNLVFDCKDGGDNPNNREMPEYRAKQDAKERAIIEQGKYNYIRLTDNNFAQLFEVIMEIKSQLLIPENEKTKVIRLNESVNIDLSSRVINEETYKSPDPSMSDSVYTVIKNCFSNQKAYVILYTNRSTLKDNYAISDTQYLDRIATTNSEGELVNIDKTWLDKCALKYSLFEFKPAEGFRAGFTPNNLLEILTQSRVISSDQLIYDFKYTKIFTPAQLNKVKQDIITNTLLKENGGLIHPELFNNKYPNVDMYQSKKGYYLENNVNGLRSGYFENSNIDNLIFDIINKGSI